MKLFGDLHTLSLVRIHQLNWIGHVKRKVSQIFNNNPQGHSIRGRPKSRWWNCVQIIINSKLKTGMRGLHCIVLYCIDEKEAGGVQEEEGE
jgi:hypothetical protein